VVNLTDLHISVKICPRNTCHLYLVKWLSLPLCRCL